MSFIDRVLNGLTTSIAVIIVHMPLYAAIVVLAHYTNYYYEIIIGYCLCAILFEIKLKSEE